VPPTTVKIYIAKRGGEPSALSLVAFERRAFRTRLTDAGAIGTLYAI